MSDERVASVAEWLAGPMETPVRQAVERARRAEDVVHVAVMPDVHLATDVCVGTAMATTRLAYPAAVGGDIGCGMLALAFEASADVAREPANAGAILRELGRRVPARRRNRAATLPLPADLTAEAMSHWSLAAALEDDGRLQFGTLGGGNHFVELQADEEDRLWLMIHSGSRALGQAVRGHHLARATERAGKMWAVDTDTAAGQAYLHDQEIARRYAAGNRAAMAGQVVELMRELFNVGVVESSVIACDHNHVRVEEHFGRRVLVHRKGAMPAEEGDAGVIPGSMGTLSFHVRGRGRAEALRSSAHGAGRQLSRHAARDRFGRADLRRQMEGVWYDPRLAEAMREEAPKAYKDVRAVMRAQAELVVVTRTLRPVLVYKGT